MKIGFCGLGVMGAPMVRKLLAAGHSVKVWNRSAHKIAPLAALGAQPVQTPALAADSVDVVLMCLYGAKAVEPVLFGADGVGHTSGLKWVADHSSIPPDATRAYAQRLEQATGAILIDAPVSGGIAGVEAGTLAIMAGGSEEGVVTVSKAMRAYAVRVTRMGPSGAGQATKLCNQAIVATTVVAIAEAIGLAQRNGIEVSKLAQALSGGWADSKPLQVFAPRMIEAPADSIGALSTMLKDVDAIAAFAQGSDAPTPVTSAVQQVLRAASAHGLGEAELSAVISIMVPDRRADYLRS